MTRAIILAQGKGSRWRSKEELPSEYKQLIPINGETVIERTVKQLREAGIHDIHLIANPTPFCMVKTEKYALREHSQGSIIQGIVQLRHLWKDYDDVLFILGNVIYSNADLCKIVHTKGTGFFGRFEDNKITGKTAKEIFAFRLVGNADFRSWIYGNLIMLITRTSMPGNLKLWDWYNDLQLSGYYPDKVNFWETGDTYTDDIDSPEEYHQFFSKLLEALKEDDENKGNC